MNGVTEKTHTLKLYGKAVLLLLLSFLFSAFRSDDPRLLMLRVKHSFFTGDNLGNIYLANEDELVKYLPGGKFFARYSNLKLGTITSVDATNPLKLLLYYRDFQQIVFLDNQLSKNSEAVSLEQLGYEQADLVCAAANNGFWLYNKQNSELIRFDENLKKTAFTGNLKQVLRSELNPNFMLEHNGYLFLNCPAGGIYVFDVFGAFSRVIALKNLNQFQVSQNIIYYQKDSTFCSYNFKLFDEGCTTLPNAARGVSAKYFNNKLYSGNRDSLIIYKFK